MSSLFKIRENTHHTRYFQVLSNESRRTVNYGLESICYRASFLWANLPPENKLANSLQLTLVFTNMVFTEFLNISNKKSRSLQFG